MKTAAPIIFEDLSSIPANPTSGNLKLYTRAGGLKKLDSSGVEVDISGMISGGSWDNVVIVNDIATDLPAPIANVITLAANTTYWFNVGTHAFGSSRLVLQNNTNIFGFGKTNTILTYTDTSGFIQGTSINIVLRDVEIQTPSGSSIQITNITTNSVYVENVNFRNCSKVASITGGGFFARYVLMVSCASSGFTFNSDLGSVIFDTCSFRALSGGATSYAIKLNAGVTITSFRCYNGIFDVAATHRGIWADSAIVPTVGGIIRGNVFGGVGAVADRLFGVNGNNSGWSIIFGENSGISGLQFIDVEVISTADAALGNPSGTLIESTAVRGYILPLGSYDVLATVMEAQITALMTNAVASNVRVGLRNLSDATNILASLGASLDGTLVAIKSGWVIVTPNRNYNAFYTKDSGASTRFALKIRIKTY